ncbi:MAG: polysaccharide pyruvyl transferase family protein [Lachnospiraceae bacterium]|nr:polysaccharide pyruvyl transferase family protein [Lachnospiraceae bacterium]
MKKILLRAGISPLMNHNQTEVIMRNRIGSNIGNMLFPASVCRALLCEDTTIDTVNTIRQYSSEHVRQINETYDCLVLPFANAFRHSFLRELNSITDLVSQLKIPCIVVGVGIQGKNKKASNQAEVDESVTRFMKAILAKSSKVGLRGERTAEYLTKLGFQAERDFTVIGCPSMYMWGKTLPEMEVRELTSDSSVSMNSKIQLPQKFHDFMYRSSIDLPNFHYVAQVIQEIRQMYMGADYPPDFVKTIPEHFPVDFTHPIYQSGKGISFTNFASWLQYLQGKDFSFGSRIHGNIASILAGTPCYIVVSDERIKELVDFHHIPHMLMKDLTEETNIFDLYEKADFSAIQKNHEKKFLHYLDFLWENGLQTIFDAKGDAPEYNLFDHIIQNTSFAPPVEAFSALSSGEQLDRLRKIDREREKWEEYLKNRSTGWKQSMEDNFNCKFGRKLTDNYQNYYPFIQEYSSQED